VDVGFRAHHGHALLKAESAVGGAREHGVNGGRGKGTVGIVQVELGTGTLLQAGGKRGNVLFSQLLTRRLGLIHLLGSHVKKKASFRRGDFALPLT
jgi:hypothetical protein